MFKKPTFAIGGLMPKFVPPADKPSIIVTSTTRKLAKKYKIEIDYPSVTKMNDAYKLFLSTVLDKTTQREEDLLVCALNFKDVWSMLHEKIGEGHNQINVQQRDAIISIIAALKRLKQENILLAGINITTLTWLHAHGVYL